MAAKYSPRTLAKTEPVITIAGVTSVVFAVLGFLVAHGYLSNAQENTYEQILTTVIPFLIPLIAGLFARAIVWPPFAWVEGEVLTHKQAVNAPADVSAHVVTYSADLDVEPSYGADLDPVTV